MRSGRNFNYRMVISYEGAGFAGWQTQRGERTVQETLENAVLKITGEMVRLFASGRTDTGVHARGLVANFFTSKPVDTMEFTVQLNAIIPNDVRVLSIENVPLDFHARYSAVGKIYRYTIFRHKRPFMNPRPDVYYWGGPLDVEKMREAASYIIGTHDFSSFGNNPGYQVDHKVKTVSKLDIIEDGDYIFVTVHGSGFLYKMVRSIVGTLLWVATGKIPPGQIPEIIMARDRTKAGPVAPACGLCLMEVLYPA